MMEYLSPATDIQCAIVVKIETPRRASVGDAPGLWGAVAMKWERGGKFPQQAISFGTAPLSAATLTALQPLTNLGMALTNDGAARVPCSTAHAATFQLNLRSDLVRTKSALV